VLGNDTADSNSSVLPEFYELANRHQGAFGECRGLQGGGRVESARSKNHGNLIKKKGTFICGKGGFSTLFS
jgi:hypothetical protein